MNQPRRGRPPAPRRAQRTGYVVITERLEVMGAGETPAKALEASRPNAPCELAELVCPKCGPHLPAGWRMYRMDLRDLLLCGGSREIGKDWIRSGVLRWDNSSTPARYVYAELEQCECLGDNARCKLCGGAGVLERTRIDKRRPRQQHVIM